MKVAVSPSATDALSANDFKRCPRTQEHLAGLLIGQPGQIRTWSLPRILRLVNGGVTRSAERNEVTLHLIAGLATEFFVVYLEI